MSLKVFLNISRTPLRGILRPVTCMVKTNTCGCRNLTTEGDGQHFVPEIVKPFGLETLEQNEVQKPPPQFKTRVFNPCLHTLEHEGKLYEIDRNSFSLLAYDHSYRNIRQQAAAFRERYLMIRKPALEIMHAMKNLDYSKPIPKFVLYGNAGNGKTMTLLHIMHYCRMDQQSDWWIVQTPWPQLWIEWCLDISNSSHKPGRIDLPNRAQEFLQGFSRINQTLIEKHVTHFKYEWTQRESAEVGTPFSDLIDYGLKRLKFSDDVIGALFKEIKYLASVDQAKILVCVDGINGFYNTTRIKSLGLKFKDTKQGTEKQQFLFPQDLTILENLKKLLQPDVVNSVCVATVDSNLIPKKDREHHTPKTILGKEGFEALNPFIPVHVPEYSDMETNNILDYYIDRKIIINPIGSTEEGKKQLAFLSSQNPKMLYKVCQAW